MLPFDRDTRRRIRILRAVEGRQLHHAYLLDPALRKDLAREAAHGADDFDGSLITPELLVDLRAFAAEMLEAKGDRPVFGAPPSAPSEAALNLAKTPIFKATESRGTVVIVPGGLASSLSDVGKVRPGPIWLSVLALTTGRRFPDLRLGRYAGPDPETDLASPDVSIAAISAFPMLYDSLSAALWAVGWTPQIFPYDWRKDMNNSEVARRLERVILRGGADGGPVHILTHSQGALVARQALKNLADAHGCDRVRDLVDKVIYLGPAIYGAFVAALAIAGSLKQIPISRLLPGSEAKSQAVLSTFTALYQLMPWDADLVSSLEEGGFDIRSASFWDRLSLGKIDPSRHARAFPPSGMPWGEAIGTNCLDDRTRIILGSHPIRKTPGGVFFRRGRLKVNHKYDLEGDGWVPDILGKIPGVTTYKAPSTGHIRLPMANRVIKAVLRILDDDLDTGLPEV